MKILVTLASVAFVSVAGMNVARAGEDVSPSITVQFADLDLDKPQGAATLFARIKTAAQAVCREFQGASPVEKARYKTCIKFAVSNAVARVDKPQLSDYFASRVPAPKAPVQLTSKR